MSASLPPEKAAAFEAALGERKIDNARVSPETDPRFLVG